jgi:hypothetical protein
MQKTFRFLTLRSTGKLKFIFCSTTHSNSCISTLRIRKLSQKSTNNDSYNTSSILDTTSTSTSTSSSSSSSILPTRLSSNDKGESSSLPSTEIVSKRAIAGLSPDYRDLLIKRAERGKSLPILYSNPGAYAQLNRLSDDIIAAIPPPPRPLYPMSEMQHTWRLAKGFSIGLVFVALAIYLYLKKTLRGNERFEFERCFPSFALVLERLHLIQDLSSFRDTLLDRKELFKRIFQHYSVSKKQDQGEKMENQVIPIEYVKYLLLTLLTLVETGSDFSNNDTSNSKQEMFLLRFQLVLDTLGFSSQKALNCKDFITLSDTLLQSQSSIVLSLASHELFGIIGTSLTTINLVNNFFDLLTTSRFGDSNFSISDIIELCSDIGFSTNQKIVSEFINDSLFLENGLDKDNESFKEIKKSNYQTKVRKDQFVDFLLSAAYEAGVGEDRIEGFLQTYTLLHLSGIKEAAGVVKKALVLS